MMRGQQVWQQIRQKSLWLNVLLIIIGLVAWTQVRAGSLHLMQGKHYPLIDARQCGGEHGALPFAVFPGSVVIGRFEGGCLFQFPTSATASDVQTFYEREMAALGWPVMPWDGCSGKPANKFYWWYRVEDTATEAELVIHPQSRFWLKSVSYYNTSAPRLDHSSASEHIRTVGYRAAAPHMRCAGRG